MNDLLKQFNTQGMTQTILTIGVVTLGIVAAVQGNWTVAGAIATGAFAILKSSDNKEIKNENAA